MRLDHFSVSKRAAERLVCADDDRYVRGRERRRPGLNWPNCACGGDRPRGGNRLIEDMLSIAGAKKSV
jgi:hypothetical protein